MIAALPPRDVPLRSTLDACAFVDELGTSATGELAVHRAGAPWGTIFVERGRICWAAARGLARRLTELLGARAKLSPTQMEQVFLSCKERRVPLGEDLVGRGVLSADDLRVALLRHTTESLDSLCALEARGVWAPRAGNGYSPKFTFTTAELLANVGATTHEDQAERVVPTLSTLFGPDEWAAAFVRSASMAFPLPIATVGEIPHAATTLVRVGKWAASVLDVAAAFTDPGALLSVTRGQTSLVAFRLADAIVAGEAGPHGTARILNRRARQRRP